MTTAKPWTFKVSHLTDFVSPSLAIVSFLPFADANFLPLALDHTASDQ